MCWRREQLTANGKEKVLGVARKSGQRIAHQTRGIVSFSAEYTVCSTCRCLHHVFVGSLLKSLSLGCARRTHKIRRRGCSTLKRPSNWIRTLRWAITTSAGCTSAWGELERARAYYTKKL